MHNPCFGMAVRQVGVGQELVKSRCFQTLAAFAIPAGNQGFTIGAGPHMGGMNPQTILSIVTAIGAGKALRNPAKQGTAVSDTTSTARWLEPPAGMAARRNI